MWYVPPLFPPPTLILKSSTSFLLIPAVQASALLALDAPNAPLVPARDIEIAKTYRERTLPISVLSSGWPVHSHLGPGADRDGWSLGLDVAVGTCSMCV
ncbi:hypothetical protein B0H10DRAFT_2094081 [Mycena sp. CBHHK59/15]|nr:hypothetical protein B0H10DRAFT_2094081 [Mycena sp. CBHHK59/15]